jgi:DNA-3-methyladenine glycosylase I
MKKTEKQKRQRCHWVSDDPLYIAYHDKEWGVPVYDDRLLFEFLILEGAQAGLSWITVLKKRENYRQAFDHFDPKKIARYTPEKVKKLLLNSGIIRNRLKIKSTIINAKAYFEVLQEFDSFADYIWSFTGGKPIQTKRKSLKEVPPRNEISDKMSKDLKKRGFKFIGSTICYAFMQAVGMVNDHTCDCFRHRQVLAKA